MAVTVQKSTAVVLSAAVKSPATNRQMVKIGHAVVVTPGATGFDVVKLTTTALDTTYTAAVSPTPIVNLGVDDVLFRPLQYPET